MEIFSNNSYFKGISIPEPAVHEPLTVKYTKFSPQTISFLEVPQYYLLSLSYYPPSLSQGCLVMEPAGRLTCDELLDHSYFEGFRDWFQPELEVGLIPVPGMGIRLSSLCSRCCWLKMLKR